MGNNNCTLVIRTEQQLYNSGDVCNGTVYLSVNDPRGIPCRSLHVQFTGIESAVVHYTSHSNDNQNGRQDHYERNQEFLINLDHVIQTPINGCFAQGQYEFPFQLVVPGNLPSSMRCRNRESYCEIRYDFKAYLQKSGISINPFNTNNSIFSSEQQCIAICGNNTAPGTQPQSHLYAKQISFPSETHRINNCCFFNRGHMTLQAQLDSDTLIPNTPYTLAFNLRNKSSTAVESVVMDLVESISWRPRFREKNERCTLTSECIEGRVVQQWRGVDHRNAVFVSEPYEEYASLPSSAPSAPAGDDSYTDNDNDNDNASPQSQSQRFTLITPPSARDTYSGRFIQVQHFVRVKVITQECCNTNPETSVHVKIVRPPSSTGASRLNIVMQPSAPSFYSEVVVADAMTLPANWSPLTADLVALPIATVIGFGSGSSTLEEAVVLHAEVPVREEFSRPFASAPPLNQK